MSFPCDVKSLLANSKCFEETCMGEEERDAVELYLRVEELAAYGGPNYRSNLTALGIAGKQYQILSKNQRQAIALATDLANTVANGSTIKQSVAALKAGAKCYECIPKETRRNLLLFLKCSLNSIGRSE
jgi:hypothetical protein